MKNPLLCFVILLMVASEAFAAPPELPAFTTRSLHILISKQVPGLVGRDRVGNYVQYSVQGQDFLSANFKIPYTKEYLESYFSRVKEVAAKGFTNPYTAVLAFAAARKFGTYDEFSAMFVPQHLDPSSEKLRLESFKSGFDTLQRATNIQLALALDIDGVTYLYYYLLVPGEPMVINEAALIKKGGVYFPIPIAPSNPPISNDVDCAFAVQAADGYLPLYISDVQ